MVWNGRGFQDAPRQDMQSSLPMLEHTDSSLQFQFKNQNPPKGAPCDKGLWYFSRHPPYFGEMTLQFGIWLLCRECSQVDLYFTCQYVC